MRRDGDPQDISHHETREEAVEAARRHSTGGVVVDRRGDLFADEPAEAVGSTNTFKATAVFAATVVALIVLLALLTG